MASCVLFGNRDFTGNIDDCLGKVAKDLILTHGVDTFYVGHQGNFDRSAISYLKQLKREFPHISYLVMLSHLPCPAWLSEEPTLFPEGIEAVPPKYAILYRNDRMLERADYVVLYRRYKSGGAARMEKKAKEKGKTIINLVDLIELVEPDALKKGLQEYSDKKNSAQS